MSTVVRVVTVGVLAFIVYYLYSGGDTPGITISTPPVRLSTAEVVFSTPVPIVVNTPVHVPEVVPTEVAKPEATKAADVYITKIVGDNLPDVIIVRDRNDKNSAPVVITEGTKRIHP